jgi:hypothetical protein
MRKACDEEVSLLNQVGFSVTRWFSRKKTLINLNPYGPVFAWVILKPYLSQRRRDTGRYWARPMFVLMLECVGVVRKELKARKDTNHLRLRAKDERFDLIISADEIEHIESDLKLFL